MKKLVQQAPLIASVPFLAVISAASTLSIGATPKPQATPDLWTVVHEESGNSRRQALPEQMLWKRVVRVNSELLRQRTSRGARLRLGLQPGVDAEIELLRITNSKFNGYVWNGRVVDEPLSMVTLVVEDRDVAGTVLYSHGSYRVRLLGDGLSTVEAQAPRRRPDIVRIPPSHSRSQGRPRAVQTSPNVPVKWDVLALYTKRAAKDNGGARSTKADWKVAVANWNTALENNQIGGAPGNVKVRLVKTRKWKQKRRGSDSDHAQNMLYALRIDKKVSKWRKKFGADFVAGAIEINDDVCGVAFLNGEGAGVLPGDGDWAMSVIPVNCLAGFGGLAVAHEGGHNAGLRHDEANASDPLNDFSGAYAYSYGYRLPGEFRTIMAYACSTDDLDACPETPFFSDPFLGALESSGDLYNMMGIPDQADNVRSLNNDIKTIEQWSDCKKAC